ncbi:TPA: GNAT family N-acetyltransferase [Candidatus Micrarchaeota archaeon]|nr:GNAT family N-acetyltransferase [Candidatus Micrarchaeota archaeon]
MAKIPIEIVRALPSDLQGIRMLYHAYEERHPGFIANAFGLRAVPGGSSAIEKEMADVETALNDEQHPFHFVAKRDGQIVGVLLTSHLPDLFEEIPRASFVEWANGSALWLRSVLVHPDHESSGVYKALVNHAFEEGKRNGYAFAAGMVLGSNPKHELLTTRLGWTVIPKRDAFALIKELREKKH